MNRKSRVTVILCLAAFALLLMAAPVFAQPTDIQGHWAEQSVNSWVYSGYINGYQDGSFKPDNSITRAEFMVLVNRSFGFTEQAAISFSDVSAADWFYGDIARAKTAGYITGYEDGTMRPGGLISRQEAASIIARLLKLDPVSTGLEGKFNDAGSIPQWSMGAIGAVTAKGCMTGYPDQTFQPFGLLTRAEAVVTLERALAARTTSVSYKAAGTYGPAIGTETLNGTVYINVAGVTLQNMIITGDLVFAEGIGEGNATLKNVTVQGKTTIKGGGSNSIILENCTLGDTTIQKEGVRVVASGGTTVSVVTLETGATLVTETNSFGEVIASAEIPAGQEITLEGNFDSVTIAADNVTVNITEGTVTTFTVEEGTSGTVIDIASSAGVGTLNLDAAATVTGTGAIDTANITAAGVTIAQTPENYTISTGESANIGGETTNGTKTGGGSGGGGGGGVSAPEVIDSTVTVGGTILDVNITENKNGTIDLSGFSPSMVLSEGRINVSRDSTLVLTIPANTFLSYDLDITQALDAGWNTLDVFEYLGDIYPAGGFTLAKMRDVFDDSDVVTFNGTLTGTSANKATVSLAVTLP